MKAIIKFIERIEFIIVRINFKVIVIAISFRMVKKKRNMIPLLQF